MKKKLLSILFCSVLVIGLTTGCTKQKEIEPNEENKGQEKSQGKCEIKECMNVLNPNMKLEEINEVIGFVGEKDEENEKYVWQLTSKTKIEVEFKEGKGSIKASYDKEQLKNDKLKLSICYEIYNNIKEKNYTYEEMVEKLEGIEGNLESLTSTSKMYSWVNKDGNTFRATFSKSNNWKSSIVSIR